MNNSSVSGYIRNSFAELSKVVWPTKNRAIRLTLIVLALCVVFALFFGLVDFVLSAGRDLLLRMSTSA